MKKLLVFSAVLFLAMATVSPAVADQWTLPSTAPYYDAISGGYYTDDGTATGIPLYALNWATTMVDGTGYIPLTTDPDPEDGYYYSSWQDPNDARDEGTFALGTPDFYYPDEPNNEADGGATGFSGKNAADSWMVLGFDQAIANRAGDDMAVYQFGWGDTGTEMEIFVSTDDAYTDDGSMIWTSLGYLGNTAKPFAWDYGSGSPYMTFDFDDAGVTGDVNFVMFEGNCHWIDAVGGAPVPIPGAVWLLGSGLLALVGIRRKN